MKLIVRDLTKKYNEKVVLDAVNFTFEKGKIYGLLGRNGAGKTTFFNCLNEDIPMDGGIIEIKDEKGISPLKSDDIGYVLSTPAVPEFLTGREFLKFFISINHDKMADVKTEDEYFDMIRIDREDRDRLIKDYSHGMKNKMMMLVHIIANPKILLLDEPLTSFDVVVAEEMKQLLRQIKKERILIFSTHIMELALDLCDEIVLLHHGKLEQISMNGDHEAFKAMILERLKEDEHERVEDPISAE